MFRKMIGACALFIACLSSAHAAFYIGAGADLKTFNLDDNNNRNFNRFNLRNVRVNSTNLYGTSAKFYFGLDDYMSGCWYLASEAFITSKSVNLRNSNPSVLTGYSYGASLIPGYTFGGSFYFIVRLGFISTEFTRLDNKRRYGRQIGVGLLTCLSSCWDVRVEYVYTRYTTVNGFRPRAHEGDFTLIYHFR